MPTRFEDCEVLGATDKAIRVNIPDLGERVWVPKSMIDDDSDVYDNTPDAKGPGDLVVKTWWAEKEGLA